MSKEQPFKRADNVEEYPISEQDNKTVATLKQIYNNSMADIKEIDDKIKDHNRVLQGQDEEPIYSRHYEEARQVWLDSVSNTIEKLQDIPDGAISKKHHQSIMTDLEAMYDNVLSDSNKSISAIANKSPLDIEGDQLEGYGDLRSRSDKVNDTTELINKINSERSTEREAISGMTSDKIIERLDQTLGSIADGNPEITSLKEKLANHKHSDKYDFSLKPEQYMEVYESAQKIKYGIVEGNAVQQEAQSMRDKVNSAFPKDVQMKGQLSKTVDPVKPKSTHELDLKTQPTQSKPEQKPNKKNTKEKASDFAKDVASNTLAGKVVIGATKVVSAVKKGRIDEKLKKQAKELSPAKQIQNIKKAFSKDTKSQGKKGARNLS